MGGMGVSQAAGGGRGYWLGEQPPRCKQSTAVLQDLLFSFAGMSGCLPLHTILPHGPCGLAVPTPLPSFHFSFI